MNWKENFECQNEELKFISIFTKKIDELRKKIELKMYFILPKKIIQKRFEHKFKKNSSPFAF